MYLFSAALYADRNKFTDPSRIIYADSLRKKTMNGGGQFMLNGLNPKMSNGHLPQQNGGSTVNINVNPLGDLDCHEGDIDSKQTPSLQELRASLQEMFHSQPPPFPSPHMYPENDSVEGRTYCQADDNDISLGKWYHSTCIQ